MLNHHLQWSMGSVFVKLPSLLENDNLENLLNKLFLHLALSHNKHYNIQSWQFLFTVSNAQSNVKDSLILKELNFINFKFV